MKIIINALSGNGDALMFSPALRQLKNKLPDAEIDMLVMFGSVKQMYMNHPSLSNVHFIDFLKQPKLRSLAEVRKLKKKEYDYSVNIYPSNRLEYNIVNSLLGAKTKLSVHYLHTQFSRGEFLNDILVNETAGRHNVLQNIDLASAIAGISEPEAGPMEIFIGNEHAEKADKWLRDVNPEGRPLAGIHAGSAVLKNHINKRWSKDGYIRLVKHLQDAKGCKVLLFGTEADLNLEIKTASGGEAELASTPDFMDSVARMRNCSLFVSNDTAFMHCAAALQLPVVAIFGYTNHKELYPWKTKHIIVRKDLECSPCFYNSPKPASCIFTGADEFKCIRSISSDEVIEAAVKLLDLKQVSR
ncbi:MAG: glycosyltransferase family 9 protein [Ignavibacteria bacterium]|nr:glycosyltransferase family 9 protein [Ignavibacteria bacterium]